MSYRASVGGAATTVTIHPDAVQVGTDGVPHVDIDEVVVDGWDVRLRGPNGEVVLSELGRRRDELLRELRAARLPARRAALLQSGTADPLASFDASVDGRPVVVTIHRDGLTVDADSGPPVLLPLSMVVEVARDGHDLTLHARALPPVTVRHLGRRTDEFLRDLDRARHELATRTREAYAEMDPALAGLNAPDGWAVTADEAGPTWPALRGAFARTERAREVEVLEELAGGQVRLGIKAAFAGTTLPFVLAPAGGRVAVEGAGSEGRATFVFETSDVDRLNAVLLLTSFRREALFLPEDQLGRWAVAVRMLPVVRWAREALAGRVVHDERWEAAVREVLAAER